MHEAKTVLHFNWKENLETHRHNIAFALAADNIGYFYLGYALTFQETSSPPLSLSAVGASDNFEGKLNEINVDTLYHQEQVFEEFR